MVWIKIGGLEKLVCQIASSLVTVAALGFIEGSYATAQVSGEKRILATLYNFQNDASQPFTLNEVHEKLFTNPDSANVFFQRNSYGKASLAGDVVGWKTILYDNTTCDRDLWADAVDALLLGDGIDANSYDARIYISPPVPACGSSAGASIVRVWMHGAIPNHTFQHELLHTRLGGLDHASSTDCRDEAIDDYANCTFSEYGDHYTIMGQSQMELNAPQRYVLGWLLPEQILAVADDGTYSISVLERDDNEIKAIRMAKPDTGEVYWIERRQREGIFDGPDGVLPQEITEGGLVHIETYRWDMRTLLVDTTPQTKGISDRDEALADGRSFCDRINGIEVAQTNHDPDSVTMKVQFGYEQPAAVANNLRVYRSANNLVFEWANADWAMTYKVEVSILDESRVFNAQTIATTAITDYIYANAASNGQKLVGFNITSKNCFGESN